MKNTLKKIVLGTLIAATAATAAIAPTASAVMADDWEFVEIEDDTPAVSNSDEYEYVYIEDDEPEYVYVVDDEPEYVYVEVEEQAPAKKSGSGSLDKTHYGETRYANVSDFLALRSRPTSDSREIARLAPNTKMTIIGTTGNWVKVYVPSVDSDGYVYNKYISKTVR